MEVTNKDILRHYLSSVLVYGVVLALLLFMPAFNQDIKNQLLSYWTVLFVYYILYVIFALPIFKKLRPESILKSRNAVIVNCFKRIFSKKTLEEKLENMRLNEDEKQAFVILFIKTFFGVYSLNLLCSKFLPQLGYDFDFLSAIGGQTLEYVQTAGLWYGFMQFIDDSADMWINLMLMITTIVYTISYLTESKILKNNIKYADTTSLGIISCIMCYYPFILLTQKFIPASTQDVIPIENTALRLVVYCLVIAANFISMIAILRLGTKSGNLTNRGIITKFPYNIVRHPDYAMQIIYVILTFVPLYAAGNLTVWGYIVLSVGLILWIGVYVIRAVTEERNLFKDEDYKTYCQKVKYRFIPKVY